MRNKPSSSIIIDTGFLYALYAKKDLNHLKAKEAAVKYNNLEWVTSCFVFHELYWLLNEANPIQIFEAEKAGIFQIVDFERSHLTEVERHVKKYSDRQIDLADASLIFLAECLGHGNILTTDVTDFTVYRWNRSRSFNLLM
jgi:predicted nucleic acid-binding protein